MRASSLARSIAAGGLSQVGWSTERARLQGSSVQNSVSARNRDAGERESSSPDWGDPPPAETQLPPAPPLRARRE